MHNLETSRLGISCLLMAINRERSIPGRQIKTGKRIQKGVRQMSKSLKVRQGIKQARLGQAGRTKEWKGVSTIDGLASNAWKRASKSHILQGGWGKVGTDEKVGGGDQVMGDSRKAVPAEREGVAASERTGEWACGNRAHRRTHYAGFRLHSISR